LPICREHRLKELTSFTDSRFADTDDAVNMRHKNFRVFQRRRVEFSKRRGDVFRRVEFGCPHDFEFDLSPIFQVYAGSLRVLAKPLDLPPCFGCRCLGTGRTAQPDCAEDRGEGSKGRMPVIGEIAHQPLDLTMTAFRGTPRANP
jgi:hypothetical protein